MKIWIINGPNVNLLGEREPDLYGRKDIKYLERLCLEFANNLGVDLEFFQSNHEGVIVDWIQEARRKADGVVINPGAYGRSSIALHSAVAAVSVPVIEVHISNIAAKESYLPPSYLSKTASGTIFGFGLDGYLLGIQALYLKARSTEKPTGAAD